MAKERLIDKTKGDPVDRVAARVTSQSKNNWEFDPNKNAHFKRVWDVPPKMRPIHEDSLRHDQFIDFTGKTKGQLTVVGLFDNTTNKKGQTKKRTRKQAWWVVRCVCGKYTIRSTRALKNPKNRNDRCHCCQKVACMKRHRDYLDGIPEKPLWEY